MFYKIIQNQVSLREFLILHNLILTPDKIAELGLICRNINCPEPTKGFTTNERRRKLTERKEAILENEGQDILKLVSLRCRGCKTRLSPRTLGFLSYLDRSNRANCKLSPEKALQIIFHWIIQRPVRESVETLGLNGKTIVDWNNFNREICQQSNVVAHVRRLGNGRGRGPNNMLPETVIQIDECLLRGKRLYNRGRMLLGDNNPTAEDRAEWENLNAEPGANMHIDRNYGRRITGPWIFGMMECKKQPDDSYKSGEVRLYIVERRNADTLLPIIRQNVQRGSLIWSDEWRAYSRIGQDDDGLLHETVNHSIQFIAGDGAHTQNIERNWSSLKTRIIKNMKGTSPALLNSHLHEFMWRSRQISGIWERFLSFIDEAAAQNPITW